MTFLFRSLSTFRPFRMGMLLAISLPVFAQTTVSLNVDYAEGKYGDVDKSSTWTMPLIIKHQVGDFAIKLNMPYVRATGTAVAGGDRFSTSRQIQEGFGDVVLSSTYGVVTDLPSGFVVDVGAKAKFATADRANDLITTGKNDYSVWLDTLLPIGGFNAQVALGWTKRGDPDGINYRNPWFSALGLSYKISERMNIGAFYDYRQKVTAGGDPVSEGMIFAEHKFGDGYRLQAYLVRGFSDASPDLGVGATFSIRF